MVEFMRTYNGIEYWMYEDSKPVEQGVRASKTAKTVKKKPGRKMNLRK